MKSASATTDSAPLGESPDFVRLSLAAAMTLGFVPGWFYRNARLGCINLLLTYAGGCKANCAFCGLAGEKFSAPARRNFIRVPWKIFPTSEVIDAIRNSPPHVSRVCISMITHTRCKDDVLTVCSQVVKETGKAVSLLISPSLVNGDDLQAMKQAGAERIGVAIDAATPEIFSRLRGKPAHGPHKWEKYWDVYEQSLKVFGEGMAGVHLICGLGETEKQLAEAISRARVMGGSTHLFSFFPERGSAMENHPSPPAGAYRRIQLARWLIDNDLITLDRIKFDAAERITSFGLPETELHGIINSGSPFETSGCPGPDGKVACNRPYGNEKPGPNLRNFPFPPDLDDMRKITEQLKDCGA
ncbi:MAG: radical SAM protein [Desulfomonile tiedjei]|uniref:Radical SAM protein n=1 Tax=Desulfomonile tiedjei TaxID=2358 RepID=A0A9D6V5G8_9BACT|nr:radical SAM protein [Desulfomonile tiedjei]